MSLPTLSHVAQVQATSSPSISDLLALIAATTYTHWDVVNIVTEDAGATTVAVLLKPKSAAIADVRILFAGHASAQTPAMQSPHTWLASCLLMRVGKGCSADTIDDWTAADPLADGGTWMGYARSSRAVGTLVPTQLRAVESAETFELEIMNTASKSWCEAGCRFRNASPTVGYEANGRLVGMAQSGSGGELPTQMHSIAGSTYTSPYIHGGFDTYGSCYVFVPGGSGVTNPSRLGAHYTIGALNLKDRNGGLLLPPVILVGDNIAVEARDIFIGPNMTDGQEVEDDSTGQVIGIALASGGTSDGAEQAILRRVVP
jgi:hypothetical protein